MRSSLPGSLALIGPTWSRCGMAVDPTLEPREVGLALFDERGHRFLRFRRLQPLGEQARFLGHLLCDRRRDRPLHQLLGQRSEEHTSELQSLRHLVCRLLLEKKKILRLSVFSGSREIHRDALSSLAAVTETFSSTLPTLTSRL